MRIIDEIKIPGTHPAIAEAISISGLCVKCLKGADCVYPSLTKLGGNSKEENVDQRNK